MSNDKIYERMVPAESFLGRYLRYMSTLETPVAYDFWSGLWIMSSVLGRDVVVARPRIPVHLNVYAFIISESGLTRKTTAVKMAKHVLRIYCAARKHEAVPYIIDDKTTPERFEALIHERSVSKNSAYFAIGIDELIRFLGRERYKMALPGLLTDLYDCPTNRTGPGTIKSGETVMQNVYVSLLGASTASWLVGAINPDVVEGGFTSRVVYIHEERRKKSVPWPDEVDEREIVFELIKCLLCITDEASCTAQVTLTPRALTYFKKWYNTRDEHSDPFNSSWDAREDEHVLRIAALLCINANRWIIEVNDLRHAIKLTTRVREAGSKLFEGTVRTDPLAVAIEHLRTLFLSAGLDPMTQTDIYNKMRTHMDRRQLKLILSVMHELDMVQKFTAPKKQGAGRPTTLWRGTEALTAASSFDSVLKKLEDQ